MVLFQAYSAIFTTLDILRHVCSHSGIFLADSDILGVLAQLDIFVYIKAYLEPMAYSDIFRTVDLFSQFEALLKSNPCIF